MTLAERLGSGWTALKIIRVILGVLILISSIGEHHIPGIILGALFTIFALFTDGVCCAGGACYRPHEKKTDNNLESIDYEELVAKK